MSLHPQCRAVLDQMAAMPGRSFEEMTLPDIQAFRAAMPSGLGLAGPGDPVARVEDRKIGSVPVRIYWPSSEEHAQNGAPRERVPGSPGGARGALCASEPNLAVVLYFHGGGWVFGNPDWVDTPCRSLANRSGAIVISVDYRLAPEHRYPSAVEDSFAVTSYVAEHAAEFGADPARISVMGDSAGGNMAAVVAQMARDRKGPPIAFQVLIYPCVDYLDQSPSMTEFAEGHFLTGSAMKWFWGQYAGAEQAREVSLSPQCAEDLQGLPRALVITAECDPLRDQGEIYAQRLRAAGVDSSVKRYDGMIHGFFHMGAVIDAGKEAVLYAASAVADVLKTSKAG